MSADSPHRSRSHSRSSVDRVTVSPQQVTDPTILDNVAGFINDVVPNAYSVPFEAKDQIQWAHFEQLDDGLSVSQYANCDKLVPLPLVLTLGYTTGIQVWALPANGEATELFAWRHGSVRVLKILPTPFAIGSCNTDLYASKRPLIALCDNAPPGPHYCSLSFISLKTGDQVKLIKFKNPILDVLANQRSVVITFAERIAIFDAFSLEDKLTVTSCYLSPGIYPNPVALGTRWLAYAENKLISSRRSSGGNEGEGVQSYTATVLHAAKSLGRGLRELGETVASSITGNVPHKPGGSVNQQNSNEILQKGIVTVLDLESQNIDTVEKAIESEAVICHFTAHKEAIVYLTFDPSGLLLLTADKRGNDFHLFRIHPHPGGPSLAAVHHLYVLHRGDTTARVQDMSFSPDSRWITVSTQRGTTHVFPVTPYGGCVGVRTHSTPHVVNRMSRFHRSAGLTAEGRSNSPVCVFEAPINSNLPYHNPRIPPYPHPTVISPLAQIRQPVFVQNTGNLQQRPHLGRQRLSSTSEDNIQVVLKVRACFAPQRAWIDSLITPRDSSLTKPQTKPVESLFIMSCHGTLVQYDLDPHHIASISKEKVCDDTPIELTVRAKAQWILQRNPNSKDLMLPVSNDTLHYIYQDLNVLANCKPDQNDERWLSQVEIVTHAGPHRRLWMGPQFSFKTHTTNSGLPVNILESNPIEVGRSKPVNMPATGTYPVLIEAGSVSSCEPSPKLLDTYQKKFDGVGGAGEIQLREDLADAMLESPGVREAGGRCVVVSMKQHTTAVAKVVNPLGTVVTVQSDDDVEIESTEDSIIHENCDEALFRPVVASKAIVFAEQKNTKANISQMSKNSDGIILKNSKNKSRENINPKTLNLKSQRNPCNIRGGISKVIDYGVINATESKMIPCHSFPEVDSSIEKVSESPLHGNGRILHNSPPKSHVNDSKSVPDDFETSHRKELLRLEMNDQANYDCRSKNKCNSLESVTTEVNFARSKSDIYDISDTISDLPDKFVPITESDNYKRAMNIEVPQPLTDLDFTLPKKINLKSSVDENEIINSDSYDNSYCRDTNRLQPFQVKNEDAVKKDKKLRNDKYQGLEPKDIVSSSEENAIDEKHLPKKIRKPKTKLGVRISADNERTKNEKRDDVLLFSKKSWSSVVSCKPTLKENLQHEEDHVSRTDDDVDSVKHKSACDGDDLKLSEKCKPDVAKACNESKCSDNLLRVEKSSDEEKVENTSSQTETTESDDSSKVPIEFTAMDTEEDSCQPDTSKVTPSTLKSNKKKSKKKRR